MSSGTPRPREKATDVAKLDRSLDDPSGAPGETLAPESQAGDGQATELSVAAREPEGGEAASSPDPQPRAGRGPRSRSGARRRPRRTSRPRPAADRTMLVHADPRGIQIAVLEHGTIVEHYAARPGDRSIVGNVYLGKVQNVLPGMEASFVDIGEARNGVLYASEVGIDGEEGEELPRIETVLKPRQPILVQVVKDPMGAKGARLTALVSLAGRHLVLVPAASSLGVSRRLPDNERRRLRDIAQAIRPPEHGLIVRTAAEGASREDLEMDLARLLEEWAATDAKRARAKPPALLYSEPQLELRVVRDVFNKEIERCIVDNAELAVTLRAYVGETTPELGERLEIYDGPLPIFEHFRVAEQIHKSLDRRVWLPSGGHLVIDRTEAMTVIDVNTGKFVGKSNLEETVLRTNLEACVEVARQLRLRDIGGIIVIDFIDMERSKNRDEVIRAFRSELERDRTKSQVFDISPLGLVQMTRKNVSTGIVETFSDPCPQCEGRGIVIHDLD